MKLLTKYYGTMKLEVYIIGTKYRYVLRRANNQPILKPSAYESSLIVCLTRVDNWIMDNGSDVHAV